MENEDASNDKPDHPLGVVPSLRLSSGRVENDLAEATPRTPKKGDAANPIHIRDPDLGDWTSKLVWWTRALVAATVISTVVAGFQWWELQKAGAQTDKTIIQLNRQADAMQANTRAFVFLKNLDRRTEPFGDDILIKWLYTWRSNGTTEAKHLIIRSNCHDEIMGKELDFSRWPGGDSPAFIGPDTEQTMVGCETAASALKSLDHRNTGRSDDIRYWFFIFGKATYDDVFGASHRLEYCYQVWWDNRRIDLGFELIPCDGVNARHNCADEDCPND